MFKNTRFNDLMEGLPRGQFDQAVALSGNDKYNKGFRSWDQLVSLIYGQVSGRQSLRELETAFNSNKHAHYHLGTREVRRTTLAEANAKRDYRLFETVCNSMLHQVKGKLKRELKSFIYLLDSTPIVLKGHGFDSWTGKTRTHRTQGLKVHMIYNSDAQVPTYANISNANVNDIQDARRMSLEQGVTYVFDKGYCDYNWWNEIDSMESVFVTRFKCNAAIGVIESRKVEGPILSDEVVELTNRNPGAGRKNRYRQPLRRVIVEREDKDRPLVLATNDMRRSAQEIADLYKSRWQVELFFKWLKQNLKIKRYLGRSENAVKTQIFIAIITYLLVYLYRARRGIKASLRTCLIELSATLMERPKLEYELLRRRQKILSNAMENQVSLAL